MVRLTTQQTTMLIRVWQLSWPMILANITVPMIGMVDTAVVGHLASPRYLNAVAIGAVVFSYLFWGLGFLRMSTTGLTAQAQGAKRQDRLETILWQGLGLALVFSIVLLVLQKPIGNGLLAVFNLSPEVYQLSQQYYEIRIWAAPFTLMNYVMMGWLVGIGATRQVLIIQLVVNAVNIVLDLLLVFGFDLHVQGVAWASVFAQGAGWLLGIYWLVPRIHGQAQWVMIRNLVGIKRLLGVNLGVWVRTMALLTGFAFFTYQSAKLGDVVLAANTVLLNFQYLMAFALDGFAFAAEVLVGQAIGGQNRQQLRQAIQACTVWSVGFALLFSGFFWLSGEWLIQIMTGIASVQQAALSWLPWLIITPIVSVASFLLDGIFLGATRSRQLAQAMVMSLGLFLPTAWLFSYWFGNSGLWTAYLLFMVYRAITLIGYFPAITAKLLVKR